MKITAVERIEQEDDVKIDYLYPIQRVGRILRKVDRYPLIIDILDTTDIGNEFVNTINRGENYKLITFSSCDLIADVEAQK